jgi:hypothetical protein
MNETLESKELVKFYQEIMADVQAELQTAEEGGSQVRIFTQMALNLLADAGETENAREVWDEKQTGRGIEHQVNGYALSENYETLDLFITIFRESEEIPILLKTGIDTAYNRILNFFRNAVYKERIKEIEDSAPIAEIADLLAHSADLKDNLVRVNIFILTNGLFRGDFTGKKEISGYAIFTRVVDLNYLFNITEKERIPIEIDFTEFGQPIPCIAAPVTDSNYQSYLAIIPGKVLADIYERFGSRLLEQNVRSFLQFTGKINKGIRATINNEPWMFLAYNNGIAATAGEIEVSDMNGQLSISRVKDLQIVNGGQTTASIYHTARKDKGADISKIFVQVKLSVIGNLEKFSTIVSSISRYANTQNRVSEADLSANNSFHIEMERLSRTIWAPQVPGQATQTRWFFERARGQYKNAILREGFTVPKRKAFELKNPKIQVFTKEDLAKFINSYQEVTDGKKVVVGPHFVVRGGQKNYVQFVVNNLPKKIDNVYFEDAIAKAIIFRVAEKLYTKGAKEGRLENIRFITVPYSISWLTYRTNGQLDLYKIWRNQDISEALREKLYEIMVRLEVHIKKQAGQSLFSEYAKKEDSWNQIKTEDLGIDFSSIKDDMVAPGKKSRRVLTDDERDQEVVRQKEERLYSVPSNIWKKIEEWGRLTESLTKLERDKAFTFAKKLRTRTKIDGDIEREQLGRILDKALENVPEIFIEMESTPNEEVDSFDNIPEINLELVKKMIVWDRLNKRLHPKSFAIMFSIVQGKSTLDEKAKKMVEQNFRFLYKKYGFR